MKETKITKTNTATITTTEGKFTVCLVTLMAQSGKYLKRKIHHAREQPHSHSGAFFVS